MTTITARTRPSGKSIVIEAVDDDGAKIAETVTKSIGYDWLVVNLWDPAASRSAALRVFKRSNNEAAARRELTRARGCVLLRRHSDDSYSRADGEWHVRQAAIRAKADQARWLAARDEDHHQVLIDLPDGRTVRVGDPRRHFTYGEALTAHNAAPGSYVRTEGDPKYDDVEWATRADLDLAGVS